MANSNARSQGKSKELQDLRSASPSSAKASGPSYTDSGQKGFRPRHVRSDRLPSAKLRVQACPDIQRRLLGLHSML